MADTNDVVDGTGKRLRAVADTLYDGNKSALARAMNMKPGSFSKYLRGNRKPGASVLGRLVRLGVNMNWFLSGEGPMLIDVATEATEQEKDEAQTSFTVDGVTYHRIPSVQVRVETNGRFRLDERGQSEWIGEAYIRRRYGDAPDQIRSFSVPGNCMAPTIRTGDRVRACLVDDPERVEAVTEGTPYLILGPAGLFIMRPHTDAPGDDNEIILEGDNPKVEDKTIPLTQWGNTYRPVAQVLELIRPL
jgi:transcriptional regulator with XRE-family HTH domain